MPLHHAPPVLSGSLPRDDAAAAARPHGPARHPLARNSSDGTGTFARAALTGSRVVFGAERPAGAAADGPGHAAPGLATGSARSGTAGLGHPPAAAAAAASSSELEGLSDEEWVAARLGGASLSPTSRAVPLAPEVEEGPVEYKLKLVRPPPDRVRHLGTQMRWRLRNGGGVMWYRLGYADDGYPRGVAPAHMAATLRVVGTMAARQGSDVRLVPGSVLAGWGPSDAERGKTSEAKQAIASDWSQGRELRARMDAAGAARASGVAGFVCATLEVRSSSAEGAPSWEEVRVAVIGDEASGKSTLVSVLTQGGLDDGRGLKRLEVFRHCHEVEAGRTSAISEQILGFDAHGGVVDSAGREELRPGAAPGSFSRREHVAAPSWPELVGMCRGGRVVVFCDTGGHERYAKTAMLSLLGRAPDLALLVVDAVKGLTRRAKERLGVVLALRLPMAVVVAKSDAVSHGRVRRVASSLQRLLRSHGVDRRAVVVKPPPASETRGPAAAAAASGADAGLLPSAAAPEPRTGAGALDAALRMTGQTSAATSLGAESDGSAIPLAAAFTAAAATVPGSREAQAEEAAGEAIAARCGPGSAGVVPIFATSSVTGAGLRSLRAFLRAVRRRTWSREAAGSALVPLHAAWDVDGVERGLVVSGVVLSGTVRLGDAVVMGPDGLGRFVSARVSSIHSLRRPVSSVEAGRSASFALEAPPPEGAEPVEAAATAAVERAAARARATEAAEADETDLGGLGMGLLGADDDEDEDGMGDDLGGMGLGLLGADDDDDDDDDDADDAGTVTTGTGTVQGKGRPLRREAYRKGMVLASPEAGAEASRRFEAELVVLRHPTAIREGANLSVFVRTIRQVAVVEALEPISGDGGEAGEGAGEAFAGGPDELSLAAAQSPDLRSVSAPQAGAGREALEQARGAALRRRIQMGARTGDRCLVRLRWQHHAEFVPVGAAVLVRDGGIRAIGRVIAVGGAAVVRDRAAGRSGWLAAGAGSARRELMPRRASVNFLDA